MRKSNIAHETDIIVLSSFQRYSFEIELIIIEIFSKSQNFLRTLHMD